MKEAERLYLVNCGICHGTKLDGNGPFIMMATVLMQLLQEILVADPVVSNMPDGQMFYSITYGKGQMGPYGSQLSTKQRWMIVHYINSKQGWWWRCGSGSRFNASGTGKQIQQQQQKNKQANRK